MRSPSPSPAIRELLHEKLDALLADCDKITNNAAHGRTLHDLDDFLFIEGRKFINAVLQQKIQERIEHTEATPESKQCPNCKKKRKHTTKSRKQ
jgi:hypothetical protein